MSAILEHADPAQLVAQFATIAAQAAQLFGTLSPTQLTWKPDTAAWSVGQCLEHLLRANRTYLPTIDAILAGTHQRTFWERLPGLPRLFGPRLIRALDPATARPTKAPMIFQPTAGPFDSAVVQTFARQQQDLAALLQRSARRDLVGTVIASPVAPFVTYSLLDAYRIIATHEHLHISQARRVMQQADFPAQLPQKGWVSRQ